MVLYTVNLSTFPGALQRCLVKKLLPPVLPAGLLGEGRAVLILRCVHLGQLPRPLPGAWLSGSCLSCEAPVLWQPRPSQAQGDTRRNTTTGSGQVSSPGVSSCSNYRSLPVSTYLDAPGAGGALICTARGHPAPGASSLSCVLPTLPVPGGMQDPGLCPPVPWDSGPVPLESQSWGCAAPSRCRAAA